MPRLQGGIEVGCAGDLIMVARFAEGGDIGVEQRPVHRRFARRFGARNGHVDLHVAAHQAGFNHGSHVIF
jgi:hypothetical protein